MRTRELRTARGAPNVSARRRLRRAKRQAFDGQLIIPSPTRDANSSYALSAARTLSGVNGTERSRTPTAS
jgi:hypothetical protein